jgi:uncharacterized protein YaaQ
LLKALNAEGFRATIVDAVGGFLHDSLVTLLVGTSGERLEEFFSLIRTYCPRRTRFVPLGVEMAIAPGYPTMIEAHVGGASVFVVPVEEFRQL